MKQQREISLVKGWRNRRTGGSQFSPIGAPENYPIWTITYRSEIEFLNDANTRALSGFERAGISGQRVVVNVALRAGNPTEYDRLRELVSALSSQRTRVAYDVNVSDVDTSNMVVEIDSASVDGSAYSLSLMPFNVSNGVTNCYLRNVTLGQTRLVTTYGQNNKRLTLQGNDIDSWTTGQTYEIVLLRSQPTVVGIASVANLLPANTEYDDALESWANGFIWCNLTASSYDLQRELSIATQVVNLQFRSVERFNEIPDFLTVQGASPPNPIS